MPPYTPQAFLEDVRNHIWQCNKSMTPHQRAALKSVPIIYKALSQAPSEVIERPAFKALAAIERVPVQSIYGYHMGGTDKDGYVGGPGAKELFVFGCDHLHDQDEMAKTLVHELGHVISKQGHGQEWAEAVQGLGLKEEAYSPYGNAQKPVHVSSPPELSGPWVDPELEAYIASLPQVDWGDVDADAEVCLRNALKRMGR